MKFLLNRRVGDSDAVTSQISTASGQSEQNHDPDLRRIQRSRLQGVGAVWLVHNMLTERTQKNHSDAKTLTNKASYLESRL